jgi:hypothetical protein
MSSITVVGGDLFHIALQQLGDATQWNRIASLNDLEDPVLTGLITLTLPSVDATAGGGFAD